MTRAVAVPGIPYARGLLHDVRQRTRDRCPHNGLDVVDVIEGTNAANTKRLMVVVTGDFPRELITEVKAMLEDKTGIWTEVHVQS